MHEVNKTKKYFKNRIKFYNCNLCLQSANKKNIGERVLCSDYKTCEVLVQYDFCFRIIFLSQRCHLSEVATATFYA